MDGISRCGNVHQEYEKMSHFINGLNPTFRDLGGQFKSLNPTKSLLDMLQYAESHGSSYRAILREKEKTYKRSSKIKTYVNEVKNSLSDVESDSSSE